jgi:hypothetical protein
MLLCNRAGSAMTSSNPSNDDQRDGLLAEILREIKAIDDRLDRQDERFAESDRRIEKTIERGDRLSERLQGIAIAVVLAAAAVIFRPLVEYLVQASLT